MLIGTNLISGIYEWVRSIKKRAKEKDSKKSLDEIGEVNFN